MSDLFYEAGTKMRNDIVKSLTPEFKEVADSFFDNRKAYSASTESENDEIKLRVVVNYARTLAISSKNRAVRRLLLAFIEFCKSF